MGQQPSLFAAADDAYAPFGDLPENYPVHTFKPFDPAFTRRGYVLTAGKHPRRYYVDLSIHECQCQKGHGFAWADKNNQGKGGWYTNMYCSHKLRMIMGIIDAADEAAKPELTRGYLKALGTRYNVFEVVSAFHKELRRGDFEQAWFWGLMLATKRSIAGVIKYMINILYEETRDHDMGEYLLKLAKEPRLITLASLTRSIAWFCASKKKWDMPHRLPIFTAEMRGYDLLAKDYSHDVAKGGNIIDAKEKAKLLKLMLDGFKSDDLVKSQRGLKGLQKLCYDDIEEHRYWLYEQLYDYADKNLPEHHGVWTVISYVNNRVAARLGIGYHELNAIADAIGGEPVDAGRIAPTEQRALTTRPAEPVPFSKWPAIPLYAHDNHTWGGKALMRRFPDQLKPGAEQTDLDFRWCGAYFGVCYRMITVNQFGTMDVPWSQVKWPKDLYRIVMLLWY